MMKLLNVKAYRQGRSFGCGPATLKMVLEFYGIRAGEARLAKFARTSRKYGTEVLNLGKTLERFDLKADTKINASFADLRRYYRRGIPTIVGWYTRGHRKDPDSTTADGHYSIVVGLDKKHIYLQDPEIGKIRKFKREAFLIVWLDYYGRYPKTKKDIFLRPLVAAYK